MKKTSIITLAMIATTVATASAADIYDPMFKPKAGKLQLVGNALLESSGAVADLYYGLNNKVWFKIGYGMALGGAGTSEISALGDLVLGAGYRVLNMNQFKFDLAANVNLDLVKNGYDFKKNEETYTHSADILLKAAWTPSSKFTMAVFGDFMIPFQDAKAYNEFTLRDYGMSITNKDGDFMGVGVDIMYRPSSKFAIGAKYVYNTVAKEGDVSSLAQVYTTYSTCGMNIVPYFTFNVGDSWSKNSDDMVFGIKFGSEF